MYVKYILSYNEVEFENEEMDHLIINSYNDVIDDLRLNSGTTYYNEYSYLLLDINEDQIPELFVLRKTDNGNLLKIYGFNVITNQAEEFLGSGVWTNVDFIDYSFKDHAFVYYYDSGCTAMHIEGKELEEVFTADSIIDSRLESYESKFFCYVEMESLNSISQDLDHDGEEEFIEICASKKTGSYYDPVYNHLIIFVDDVSVYTMETEEWFSDVVFEVYSSDADKPLFYLALYKYSAVYCGVLQYFDETVTELTNMEQLINGTQLVKTDGVSAFNIEPTEDGENDFLFHFVLQTVTFGELEFSMEFEYKDNQLTQKSIILDIRDTYLSYTLTREKEVYDGFGSRNVKFILEPGQEIQIPWIWVSNGIIWVFVADEKENFGWFPAGADAVFLEVSHLYGAEVEENIEENANNPIYFDSVKIPSPEELFLKGEQTFKEEDFVLSYFYYTLIPRRNKYYIQAQERISAICQIAADEMFPKIQEDCDAGDYQSAYDSLIALKEFLNRDDRYEEYKDLCEENGVEERMISESTGVTEEQESRGAVKRKKDLINHLAEYSPYMEESFSCADVDLDLDGTEEIIVRMFSDADFYRGFTHVIYWYDEDEDDYIFSEESRFFTPQGIFPRFWEEMGYLVLDVSYGATEYEVFSFSNGALNMEYSTTSDLSGLEDLEFTEIPDQPDISWKQEQNMKTEEERYAAFTKDTKESVWDGLSEREYTITDIDADGRMEMIQRAWDVNENMATIAVYKYDASQMLVKRIEVLNSSSINVYYSSDYDAIVTYCETQENSQYTYYSMAEPGMKEKFVISSETNGTKRRFSITENGEKQILTEVEEDVPVPEEWKVYMDDLQELVFVSPDESSVDLASSK